MLFKEVLLQTIENVPGKSNAELGLLLGKHPKIIQTVISELRNENLITVSKNKTHANCYTAKTAKKGITPRDMICRKWSDVATEVVLLNE